jgi:hypothetical protein
VNSRLSLEEAIDDPILFKNAWSSLAKTQQVIVRALYGLPLTEEENILFNFFQERGECDELGFPTKVRVKPYVAKEYEELVLVAGRRFGKTSKIGSFILAYEAICGGHRDFASSNQDIVFFNISQQLDIAKANMAFVREFLESTKFLEEQVTLFGAEKYTLKDGSVIAPSSPSIKRQRGLAVPAFLADEVGFWSLDLEAANPDTEVEAAIRPSTLQFPHKKRLWLSTPYVKYGILYDYYMAGTDGCKLNDNVEDKGRYNDILVCWTTTATGGHPQINRKVLEKERAKDPRNFEREYLCKFVDSITGFLNADLVGLAFAASKGVAERPNSNGANPHNAKYQYVAAIDPAFRRDNFAFVVLHRDEDQNIVLDMIKRWVPLPSQKNNPQDIMEQIAGYCAQYGVKMVYTDQFQFEALNQIALNVGIGLQMTPFDNRGKNRIFGTLEQLVNQRKIILLDDDLSQEAKELRREMLQLEKKLTGGGRVQISAPEHLHDDLVFSLALATHHAVSVMPIIEAVKQAPLDFERDHVRMTMELELIKKRPYDDLYS